MATKKVVRIDALPASAWRYSGYDAIVCIDLLLSSTTIVTALAQGRRVFATPTHVDARWLRSRVDDAFVATDSVELRRLGALRGAGRARGPRGGGRAPSSTSHLSPR